MEIRCHELAVPSTTMYAFLWILSGSVGMGILHFRKNVLEQRAGAKMCATAPSESLLDQQASTQHREFQAKVHCVYSGIFANMGIYFLLLLALSVDAHQRVTMGAVTVVLIGIIHTIVLRGMYMGAYFQLSSLGVIGAIAAFGAFVVCYGRPRANVGNQEAVVSFLEKLPTAVWTASCFALFFAFDTIAIQQGLAPVKVCRILFTTMFFCGVGMFTIAAATDDIGAAVFGCGQHGREGCWQWVALVVCGGMLVFFTLCFGAYRMLDPSSGSDLRVSNVVPAMLLTACIDNTVPTSIQMVVALMAMLGIAYFPQKEEEEPYTL